MRKGHRALSFAASLLLTAAACSGDKKSDQGGATATPGKEPEFSERPEAVPADLPGVSEDARAHLNLQNLVHLADVDHQGLFIDFGTPARAKYTVGSWKTGWGKDGTEGTTTFTNVASNTGRVYLPLSSDAAVTLRFRLKPIGTGTMQLYLNNEALPVVRLDQGAKFADYDVAVPQGIGRAGENALLLRFGDTVRVGDEDVSVAMDSLRVVPQAAADAAADSAARAFVVPTYDTLVKDVTIGESQRKAIVLEAPTTLSYFIEIPKSGKLSLRLGAPKAGATARVRITPEGGSPTELVNKAAAAAWDEQVIALDKWAGTAAKLELVAEGSGSVAFSSPSILVPETKLDEIKTPAKNVVVLLIDTMRADFLRTNNEKTKVKTPVLEQLAKEGVVFDAAQSPENWTKPSVASVLTGLYPMTHGTKQSESRLSDSALMVSEVLKGAGFATGTFLANGYVSDKFGFKQGWDHYTNYIRENKSTLAENVFKDAGDWVEKQKDKRFFAYIQTIDPHVPYDPPAEFLKLYDAGDYTGPVRPRLTPQQLEDAKASPAKITFSARDREYLVSLYNGEVSYHDHHLGTFIERLKKLGLYDQTVFVIVSDHGEEFYDHSSYGHGHSVYQELLHVPFIVRWPGVVPAARHIEETVSTVDVSPTILSAVGVPVPDVMEGHDRVAHMRGEVPTGPAVAFSDFLDDRRVIRAGRWKLILRGLNVTLFDLQTDPSEKTELDPQKHPVAMRYCRTLLGQFMGAADRGDWLSANQTRKSVVLKQEAAEMDDATKAGLKALGYAN
jgi:choline-sulfatase